MKALGYKNSHQLDKFQILEVELPTPHLKPMDVLVKVRAISFNPVDYKIRQNRSSSDNKPVILGWDATGIIEAIGSEVKGFSIGDEIYYAGDLDRDGAYAELQAIDSRLIAKKPKSLSFAESAAIPLTFLTAWEALFERGFEYTAKTKVLIIGGAGGVGSAAIQLLKAKTSATVIATASRPETISWVKDMGADIIINHHTLEEEMKKIGEVDIIFGTTHTKEYLKIIPDLLRPFGSLCLIDDPEVLDIRPFKTKALNVHWEFMFAKSMFNYNVESQGQILQEVAKLVDEGKIKSTLNSKLKGLTADNIFKAHQTLESASSIGKIVLEI